MLKSLLRTATLPLVLFNLIANSAQAALILGDAPLAPTDLSGLPGRGPQPKLVTGGFSVNTSSREQVREFYNAVYFSSDGVPINSTAVTSSCFPGTNSPAFVNATLQRINWFRAMAGLPAAVTFNAAESAKDQAAAIMMSEHGALQHVGDWTGWNCVSSDGTNASAQSNLALGYDGANAIIGCNAITGYILDNGGNNYEVGHRRWILYPQTRIMGTGDVPAENSYPPANATWVFDANYGGPRPATRTPYCAWPPAGYVPYQVVFPQWSFALSNADLHAATVTMSSNGVAVPVTLQSYVTGYGENTLVWYPSSLNAANDTTFPFNGTDTVYSVTIGNVSTSSGVKSFSYNVTLFDPSVAGSDYSALVITGTNQPFVNVSNLYTCTVSTNPGVTGYQWLVSSMTNGDFVDKALNGLTNFTIYPPPSYSVISAPPVGSGNCFHLCHTNPNPTSQLLQMKKTFYVTNTTTLSFSSLLGYASSVQVARVQISSDGGGSWQDLFTEPGSNGAGESTFTPHSISLQNYAGKTVQLRFNYDLSSGSYYYQTSANVGWSLENIIVTNSQQLLSITTNSTSSTNFYFMPPQTGTYLMQTRSVIFTDFPTDPGVAKTVNAVVGPPVISVKAPAISGNQVTIKFTLASGTAPSFHLLQANQLGSPWTTNTSAVFTTNVPGSSYQFTTTNGSATRFYRIVTP